MNSTDVKLGIDTVDFSVRDYVCLNTVVVEHWTGH